MGAHRAAVIRPQVRDEFQSFGKGLPPYDFFFIYRSIISFAVIDICHPVWSVLSHFPRAVSADHLLRAVLISDPQFRQKCLPVGIMPVDPRKYKGTDRPSSGDDRCQCVISCEHISDIIDLILHLMFI